MRDEDQGPIKRSIFAFKSIKKGEKFNENNICYACIHYEKQKETDWNKRWHELELLCDKYRGCNGNGYDCAIAVSGGKDSLVLLSILKKMAETHNFRIIAVTIDEGIPGYRDEALEIVKSFCSKLDVEFRTYSYKELYDVTLSESLELREDEKTTSCSICGIFRRRALDHAAKELGANVIATGHNLDDSLQTFLINTLSGDSNKIGWMSPGSDSKQIRKIKPLAEIYESEIVFYAFTNDLPFQTEPCPHMNEGIRTEIREFLNSLEDQHSGIKNNMYRSIIKISEVMKDSSFKEKRVCTNCGNQCTGKICAVCNMITDLKKQRS